MNLVRNFERKTKRRGKYESLACPNLYPNSWSKPSVHVLAIVWQLPEGIVGMELFKLFFLQYATAVIKEMVCWPIESPVLISASTLCSCHDLPAEVIYIGSQVITHEFQLQWFKNFQDYMSVSCILKYHRTTMYAVMRVLIVNVNTNVLENPNL